jgi:succinate dehydrogenase/fumarate reductase iron-sulfur protein
LSGASRTLSVEIVRFDPERDAAARTVRYVVPREDGMVVADVLQHVYEHEAPDLGFLWECRTRRCGTCAVRMNDRPVLGCSEPAREGMRLAPLADLAVVRDLVVDRLGLRPRLAPWSGADSLATPLRVLERPAEIEEYRGLSECIDCFICDSVCPALKVNAPGRARFAGPRELIRTEAQIQRRAESMPWLGHAREGHLSLCTRCFACTEACPRDLRPMEAIGALTGRLFESGDLDSHKRAHIGTFLDSVRKGGWLDEFRLLVDVYGLVGVLRFVPQALVMLSRGKLPKPHLGTSPQGRQIGELLDALEKGALPRPSIATKREGTKTPHPSDTPLRSAHNPLNPVADSKRPED